MKPWELRRNQLEDWLSDGYRETDKIVVAVSSAVVAFSAAFVRDIQDLRAPELVGISSISLLVSIGFVLCALTAEEVELRHRINDLNKTTREGGRTWRNLLIEIFNISSKVTFLLGIGCVAVFLLTNTSTGSDQ